MNRLKIFILLLLPLLPLAASAQLVTVSNKCYKQIQEGNQRNEAGNFQEALDIFVSVLKNCSAKDGKEQGNVGKAIALNGLKKYEDAIEPASAAIKLSKNKNVMAYYARSYAYQNLDQRENARSDLFKITELTKKNKNVKSRATMFAQLAQLDFHLNGMSAADSNLTKAIELDGTNPAFFVQKGDMQVKIGNYTEAFDQYDKAVDLGKKDLEMYQIRTEARLKQLQGKYPTRDIKELADRMTKQEKSVLCQDLKKALELGLRNIQLDLLSGTICD
jgi:tetratricopeptide (TPR) repeat protein